MSHVDEGTLHAFLDGALDTLPAGEAERVRRHLADCDVCGARLEEERALRDEASAILGGATLDLGDLPTFAEVRARARTGGPAAAPGHRLSRLGWAASVVLALGTGWMLRGGIPQAGEPAAQPATRPVVEPADPFRDAAVSAEESEAVPDDAPPPAVAPATESREVAPGVGAEAPSERETLASTVAEGRDPRAEVDQVAPAEPSVVTEDRFAAAPAAKVVDDRDVAGDTSAAATTPAELWASAQRSRQRLLSDAYPLSAGAVDPSDRRAPEPAAEQAGRFVTPVRSFVPARGEAAKAAAESSLVVPGLSVLSVTWLEEPELRGAVRVLQLMDGGDTLELVHLPAGVDPAVLPAVSDDRTQVRSPRDRGWLVARARAPADVLLALLRRLQGGG